MAKANMRYGKISPAEHDRCVRNPIRRMEALAGGKQEKKPENREATDRRGWERAPAVCARPIGGMFDLPVEMIAAQAVCQLQAGRIIPETENAQVSVSLQFVLTVNTSEQQLRGWIERVYIYCVENHLQFAGADAFVSDAAARDLLSVQAFRTEPADQARFLEPGTRLYMAGHAGKAGTGIIADAMEGRLRERFPAVMVERGRQFLKESASLDLLYALEKLPGAVCWPVLDGGFLGSLWDMAQYFGTGMEIDLRAVPIMQETIEICDYLSLHPYQLYSCGAVILAVPPENGGGSIASDRADFTCAYIGMVTEGKACTLRSGEDTRFLDKRAMDALSALMQPGGIFTFV